MINFAEPAKATIIKLRLNALAIAKKHQEKKTISKLILMYALARLYGNEAAYFVNAADS